MPPSRNCRPSWNRCLCRIATLLFALLWAMALVLLMIGTFGWFGQPQDPLAGIFLLPLGLPWNLLGDRIGLPASPLALLLAPGINLLILGLLCRWLRN